MPRRIMIRAFAFSGPILICLAISQVVLYRVGENWSMAHVIGTELAVGETLFNRLFVSPEMRRHHFQNLLKRKPEIVAFGSSTSMQFRAAAFGPYRARFYNAGGLTQRPEQLADQLEELIRLGIKPGVLLVGVDPWWLSDSWIQSQEGFRSLSEFGERSEFRQDLEARLNAFNAISKEMLRNPSRTLSRLFDDPPNTNTSWLGIGVAGREGSGFRGTDGSYRYEHFVSRVVADLPYVDDSNTLARIASGSSRFEPLTKLNINGIETLHRFLSLAQENGVVVALYLIPFPSPMRVAIEESAKHSDYFDVYRSTVRELARDHDMPLVDAIDASKWGFDDRAFINGFHGSEVVMTRIVLELLKDPRFAQALPDLRASLLSEMLQDPGTTPGFLGVNGPG